MKDEMNLFHWKFDGRTDEHGLPLRLHGTLLFLLRVTFLLLTAGRCC